MTSELKSSDLAAAVEFIKTKSSLIFVSHVNPDFDAYGSSCALALACALLGLRTYTYNLEGAVADYNFIPGVSEVQSELPDGKWDGLVVCDCGDEKRVGADLRERLTEFGPILNVDHHVSNSGFGEVNLVDTSACSTAEIVYQIIVELGIDLTQEIAIGLLAGIIGDTGSFRYESTSSKTFDIAKALLATGVKINEVCEAMYGNRSLASVKIQGEALSNAELQCDNRVIEGVVSQEMLQRHNGNTNDCEGLVESLRDISGIELAAFYREDTDGWKVSLRSVTPDCDVAAIAASFGGGGHKVAAGFKWDGPLEELRAIVITRLSGMLGVT